MKRSIRWKSKKRASTQEVTTHPSSNIVYIAEETSFFVNRNNVLKIAVSEIMIIVYIYSEYAILQFSLTFHIPRYRHICYIDLLEESPDNYVLKDFENIFRILISQDITEDKLVVLNSSNPPQVTLTFLILKEMGYSDIRLCVEEL